MHATAILLALLCVSGSTLGQNKQNQPEVESTTSFFSSVTVPKGSTLEDVICIACSAEIQGRVTGDLVLIGGNADITGSVDGDVVVVGGWIRTRGPISGEAFALGGNITREAGGKIAGEAESVPWLYLPGQRSLQPVGALCLVGGLFLLALAAGLIWKPERSDRLADRLLRRWWLALLVGIAAWYLYLEFLDEYEPESMAVGFLFLALLLLLFTATWFGFYAMAWAVGARVFRSAAWKTRLAGALILSVALLVPVLGFFVLCLIFTIGLGAGLLFTWPAMRGPKPALLEPPAPEIP